MATPPGTPAVRTAVANLLQNYSLEMTARTCRSSTRQPTWFPRTRRSRSRSCQRGLPARVAAAAACASSASCPCPHLGTAREIAARARIVPRGAAARGGDRLSVRGGRRPTATRRGPMPTHWRSSVPACSGNMECAASASRATRRPLRDRKRETLASQAREAGGDPGHGP